MRSIRPCQVRARISIGGHGSINQSILPSVRHSITMSLCHSVSLSLHHSVIAAIYYSISLFNCQPANISLCYVIPFLHNYHSVTL